MPHYDWGKMFTNKQKSTTIKGKPYTHPTTISLSQRTWTQIIN